MRDGEYILVDRLPGFIAEALGTGVIGKKFLSFPEHGTCAQAFCSIFSNQFRIKCLFEDRNFALVHKKLLENGSGRIWKKGPGYFPGPAWVIGLILPALPECPEWLAAGPGKRVLPERVRNSESGWEVSLQKEPERLESGVPQAFHQAGRPGAVSVMAGGSVVSSETADCSGSVSTLEFISEGCESSEELGSA